MPQGSVIAGCPVTSNGAVLGSISKARLMMSMRGPAGSGSLVARNGRVGISKRSYLASAVS